MNKNYRYKTILITCFLLAFSLPKAGAQDSVRKGKWLTADILYGAFLPEYPSRTSNLIQQHISAFELDYVSKPSNRNNWIGDYHSPELGVAAFYEYLGNPVQVGNMFSVYPFVNLHLNKSFKEGLYVRVGCGLCYLPVIFDRIKNSQNILIGSHIDALITFRLNYHLYLSDKSRVDIGLGIAHSSNGDFKTPNNGINVITTNLGFSYGIFSLGKFAPIPFSDSSKHKRFENDFIIATGLSEVETPGGIQYPEYTFSYMLYRRMNAKSKLGLGVDIFYNKANIERMEQENILLTNKWENTQIGIKATYELVLGKIALPFEVGGYAYTQYKGNGLNYYRIGIRYYVTKHFIVNVSLLTHTVKPDFVEWGIGYTI